jgi:hypothetical protein
MSVTVHRRATGTNTGEVGDIFLMGGDDPCMLIVVPYGPDSDHCTYNMLSLKRGCVVFTFGDHHKYPGFCTIKSLMAHEGQHFSKLEPKGYVVVRGNDGG